MATLPASARTSRLDNARGALWHLVSALLFTVMAAMAKHLSARLPSIEVAFARAFIGFLFLTPLLIRIGAAAWCTERLSLHITRSMAGTVGLVASMYAVAHLPLAEAVSLSFTKPLFEVVLAALILRETVRAERWIATAVGFMGVLIMLQPGAGAIELAGLIALTGAMCGASVGIALRRLAQDERHLTILAYLGVVSSVITFLPTAFVFVAPTVPEFLLLSLMSLIGVLGQLCFIRGYSMAEASALAPIDYTRLPFAALIGILLFLELPDLRDVMGALIIVGAALFIARREAGRARERQG